MKKTIICIVAAILMLSFAVSAIQAETSDLPNPRPCTAKGGICKAHCDATQDIRLTEECSAGFCCKPITLAGVVPDAEGNIVCGGSGSYLTKYNPEKLNTVMKAVSADYLVDESTSLVECTADGRIVISYRADLGAPETIDFGKIYGTVTASPETRKIEIANGGFEPFETQTLIDFVPLRSVIADSITLQFVPDAQQKIKPMIRISKDGAYNTGNIFFGCQNKDESGRALICEMSGQLLALDSETQYISITGSGFVADSTALQTYLNVRPKNIEELKEEAGNEDIVIMPLSNMNQIKVWETTYEGVTIETIEAKPSSDGSSAFNYLKIKSRQEVDITPIGEGRASRPLTEEISIRPAYSQDEDITVTVDSSRVSAKQQKAFAVISGCLEGKDDIIYAKASVFIGNDKLLDSESCSATLIMPPLPGQVAVAGTDWSYLWLKPAEKKIQLEPNGYTLKVWLLPGYDTVEVGAERGAERLSPPSVGSIIFVPIDVRIMNPRNNIELYLSDEQINILPEGTNLADLGFNFKVKLYNVESSNYETLECNKAGECTLEGTRVFGITAAPLQETRGAQRTGRRFEPGTKAASPETIPPYAECEINSECKPREKCIEGECLTQCTDDIGCVPGMICTEGFCRTGCNSDIDCIRGQECINRMCRIQVISIIPETIPPYAECEIDSECKPREKCVEGECLTQCTDDISCVPGMICTEGFCRTGCNSDVDCPRVLTCDNGICTSPIPPYSLGAKGVFAKAWGWVKNLFA